MKSQVSATQQENKILIIPTVCTKATHSKLIWTKSPQLKRNPRTWVTRCFVCHLTFQAKLWKIISSTKVLFVKIQSHQMVWQTLGQHIPEHCSTRKVPFLHFLGDLKSKKTGLTGLFTSPRWPQFSEKVVVGLLTHGKIKHLKNSSLMDFGTKRNVRLFQLFLVWGKNKCINGVGTAQIGKTELPNGRARKEANHETYFVWEGK